MDVGKLGLETLPAVVPTPRFIGPLPKPEKPVVSLVVDQVHSAAAGSATPSTNLLDPPAEPPKVAKPKVEQPKAVVQARHRVEVVVLPKADESSHYGAVERTSLHPNEYIFNWKENAEPLGQAIKANKVLAAMAKVTLDPAQQAAYDQLWKLTADDIGAQAALQLLVIEGTLNARSSGSQAATLLDELSRLANKDYALAPGLDRTALVCDLMQEIAFPSSISQRYRGTCTVTSAQILLAMSRPAEYARIVRHLASETTDPFTLAGGGQWQREPGTEAADDSKRTASSRLFQAAAMESQFANADYDNTLDKHRFEDGTLQSGGGTGTIAAVVKDLLGPGSYVEPQWQNGCGGSEGLTKAILEAAQNGHPTLVALYRATSDEAKQGGAAHEILVVGTTDTGVRFINPWGQTETATKDDLIRMVIGAVFVNLDSTESPAASIPPPRQP